MISNRDAEEILKHEYHRDNFEYIAKEILLPDYKQDEHETDSSSSLFGNVTFLGESAQCDLTVFEVELLKGTENRRVAITQDMFKILKGLRINNALVAFYNHDKRNYRISLLTSKYEFDGDKIVKVISNPRRFSYSLGFGTKTKTAYKFLINKGKVNSIEELTSRFSVEVVNKEFYSQIACCFTQLVGGIRDGKKFDKMLNLYGVTDQNKYAEFAVRLIGRIMFCWFLREKKSEQGIPLVPDNMLSVEQYDNDSTSYYHNVLEPLFFELLNTNQNRRKDKYGKEALYNQIPYLNGGLFSPHNDDLYKYDNVSCGGRYGLVTIPNAWFKDFYNVLGQYNFTVDENTSYDIELSIDPEMLGRIFENLLAEINHETGENAKKSTGSFYTPRDIVDYMVDSSILEYLKEKTNIDEAKLKALISYGKEDDELAILDKTEKKSIINALYSVTVLDPACGSGAFPIGMLQKVVYILQEIDPEANLWFDKATENVGILLKKEFEKKFNAGSLNYIRKLSVIQNSIFGVDIQPIAVEIARLRCFLSLVIEEKVNDDEYNRGVNALPNLDFKFIIANSLMELDNEAQMSLFENQDHISELKAIREEYFNADSARRTELKLEFADVQKQMYQETIANYNKQATKRYQQLSDWSPFKNEATTWFDSEWMFGIKNGFDIVIGNPPYFVYQKEHVNEIERIKHQSYAKVIGTGKLNAYRAFVAKTAYCLLHRHGILCMIFQNSFLGDASVGKLREFIMNNHSILKIDSFPERDNVAKRVFEGVKMSVCILTMKEGKCKSDFILNKYTDKFFSKEFETNITLNAIKMIDEKNFTIPMIKNSEMLLLSKIFSKKMVDIKSIEGEINMTFHKHLLSEEANDYEVIKGAGIQRYRITKNMSQGKREFLNKNIYEKENTGEKTKHYQFKRIAMQGITGVDDRQRLIMTIVPNGMYLANSCNYILKPAKIELEYLLGILNSKLMNWVFKKTSTNSNVNCYEVNNLPIPLSDIDLEKLLISKVTDILQSKIDNDLPDTTFIEDEINQIVYQIYGLTEEEIAIVEGKNE